MAKESLQSENSFSKAFEMFEQLSEEEKLILRRETTHRWHQPYTLYFLVVLCSMAAAVQGVCDFPDLPFKAGTYFIPT